MGSGAGTPAKGDGDHDRARSSPHDAWSHRRLQDNPETEHPSPNNFDDEVHDAGESILHYEPPLQETVDHGTQTEASLANLYIIAAEVGDVLCSPSIPAQTNVHEARVAAATPYSRVTSAIKAARDI